MLNPRTLFLGLMPLLVTGFTLASEPIPNWQSPATWTPTRSTGVHTMTDVTSPAVFVGVTPCRVADTRGNGFTGAYGPPALAANANRNFIIGGVCGIPSAAGAVSFNFGALNVGGAGDLRVFPQGADTPLVSTMNYNASTPNIANAAVVPLGVGKGITVRADAVSVDLIIDVNGYYIGGAALNTGEAVIFLGDPSPLLGLLAAFNTTTSTNPNSSSVRGFISSPNGAGVHGVQAALTGANFGVRGDNASASANSAGVLGYAGGRTATLGFRRAGVRGESATDLGILGITNLASSSVAVIGEVINTSLGVPFRGSLGDAFGSLGVSYVGGLGGSGAKSFYEPHPTDPEKVIRYVSLEGPEAGTYFRGTAHVVRGQAVITVPEDFRIVTDDEGLTVQLTPVGSSANMWIASEDLNQITVRSSKDVTFHYLVQGVRRNYKDFEVVTKSPFFQPRSPDDRMIPSLADGEKARLIANGTYNLDGTVNMQTAERLGWAAAWRAREEPSRSGATGTLAPNGPATAPGVERPH
jgi:hypothetical protein